MVGAEWNNVGYCCIQHFALLFSFFRIFSYKVAKKVDSWCRRSRLIKAAITSSKVSFHCCYYIAIKIQENKNYFISLIQENSKISVFKIYENSFSVEKFIEIDTKFSLIQAIFYNKIPKNDENFTKFNFEVMKNDVQ